VWGGEGRAGDVAGVRVLPGLADVGEEHAVVPHSPGAAASFLKRPLWVAVDENELDVVRTTSGRDQLPYNPETASNSFSSTALLYISYVILRAKQTGGRRMNSPPMATRTARWRPRDRLGRGCA
jgi:hypothetical protein